jgi:hypothetical protein
MFDKFISEIIKGIFLGFLYLQITLVNDTTVENITRFAIFYIIIVYGAMLSGVQTNVITGAFLTKTIFTLIDERVKKPISEKN